MNVKLKSVPRPLHTPEFLKERKFLVMIPVLILPFLTMAFWVLRDNQHRSSGAGASTLPGLNATLPQAQLKEQKKQDKMSVYQIVKADSADFTDNGVQERFVRSMGLSAATAAHSDSIAQRWTASLTGDPSAADANEVKIQAKLSAIRRQINTSETTIDNGNPGQRSNTDVKRLELMMKAMNGNTGANDPEMTQLTQVLQQINDLQNPGNAHKGLRDQSLKNHGRVYPVIAASDDDTPSEQVSDSYAPDQRGLNNAPTSVEAAGNTIPAVVHEDQTLVNGAIIKLRLLNGLYSNGTMIPKGSFIYGICTLNNERLNIKITTIRYLDNVLPVALSVYDLDGMEGLYVPGSIGRDATKNGAGDALQSMQLLSMDQSAGTQAASAGIEAAKGLFNRKIKQIKVKVKAGYEVLLKDNNDLEH